MRITINDFRLVISGIALILPLCALAQSDELNRSVTVERDFQPVIQAAGKVSTKPAVVETTIEPAPIEYSEYTTDVTPAATFHPLLSQPTRFEPGRLYNGYIRGGIGHPNTLFDFGYHLDDGKRSILDVYAHHKAEWGLATLSKTKVGLDFTHPFYTCDLYFSVNGGNLYYHKYGHFYNYNHYALTNRDFGGWEKNKVAYPEPHKFNDYDLTSLWSVEAFIGVKSNPKNDIQWQVQTGYVLFSKPGTVSEHQLRTKGGFDWHSEAHHVGTNIGIQNNFLQPGDNFSFPAYASNRHNFRIEPYYAYEGTRVRVHAGVNLDLNIGHGQMLSGSEKISFAPSPHINFEAQVAKQWLTIYADVMGHHGLGSLQEFMETNRYRRVPAGIADNHATEYTPVDAELGFHIRPVRDLLIELHGGYAYMMNQTYLIADLKGDLDYAYADYQRGKVGGQINYHLQDKVRINVHGDYYFWKGDIPAYDRPVWELGVRVDGRIDRHWSLYSANRFVGNRLALDINGIEHTLRPIMECNAGVQYNMWVGKEKKTASPDSGVLKPEPKPNLTLFFELENWLHHKNEYYYGYRSQGISFLLGATYRF